MCFFQPLGIIGSAPNTVTAAIVEKRFFVGGRTNEDESGKRLQNLQVYIYIYKISRYGWRLRNPEQDGCGWFDEKDGKRETQHILTHYEHNRAKPMAVFAFSEFFFQPTPTSISPGLGIVSQ